MKTIKNNYTVCKRFQNLIPFANTFLIKTVGVDTHENIGVFTKKNKSGKCIYARARKYTIRFLKRYIKMKKVAMQEHVLESV